MDPNMLSAVAQVSNPELLARVTQLAQREREATAALIAHLAELDQRRLYLAEGYSSSFTYCTQVLHLSEHAAYGRIEAARAARRFPVLLERLAEGAVTLTATDRPRKGRRTAPGSRHIPAEVTRAVWLRDGGRCAFVGAKGHRCTEQGFLECQCRDSVRTEYGPGPVGSS